MLSEHISKVLLDFSAPVMITNVIQVLFNIIDMTILKIYDAGNRTAVDTVRVCGTLISLVAGLVMCVATCANVTIFQSSISFAVSIEYLAPRCGIWECL